MSAVSKGRLALNCTVRLIQRAIKAIFYLRPHKTNWIISAVP
jgi:hypothetical protein